MRIVTLEEAKSSLAELIHRLTPGEYVTITENDEPVARLMVPASAAERRKVPQLGTLRGTVLSIERFNEPLEDFKEYMA
jgi:antitoxin (DNA-binding transcriptional repressor) of toxin-antitoxin stability system